MKSYPDKGRGARTAKLGALLGSVLAAALLATAPVETASAKDLKVAIGQADLMATPLGLSFAGSKRSWGSTAVLDNPGHAQATGRGPKGDLCLFEPVAFRPFNKGEVDSGQFKTKVLVNKKLAQHPTFDLEAHKGLPHSSGWYKFPLELPSGKSTIKIVLDSNKQVAESDEGNTVYTVNVQVNFPCGGGIGGFQAETQDGDDQRGNRFGKRLKRNAD